MGVYQAAPYFATEERPPRIGQKHRGSAAYRVFASTHGHISFGASQQNFCQRLCVIVKMPELLVHPRFVTNADRVAHNDDLVAILQARLKTRPAAHWLAALEQAGIPCGPVLHYDEVLTDPQIMAREMVVGTEHTETGAVRTLGVPVKMSATPARVHGPAPRLGEHADAVRARLRRG